MIANPLIHIGLKFCCFLRQSVEVLDFSRLVRARGIDFNKVIHNLCGFLLDPIQINELEKKPKVKSKIRR